LRVWTQDSTDKSFAPRGKQVTNPKGIFYTAVSGIWRTVWIEPVEQNFVSSIKITPKLDEKSFEIQLAMESQMSGAIAEIKVLDSSNVVAQAKVGNNAPAKLKIDSPKLWSPDSPFLYDIEVSLFKDGKMCDSFKSYAAMRKISVDKSKDGRIRMRLNNQELYQIGPLDQGWWPDGLYTAPTDEALKFDIIKTKEMGFNMIRKHVKVEPQRWYWHCDKLGMLVWQDMPSGDKGYGWTNMTYYDAAEPNNRSAESEQNYYREWNEIMSSLYSHPCIVVWTPFNEGWGQFKTKETARKTKLDDPTRLVNPASGGNYFQCGDILDLHIYPAPKIFLMDYKRANVIGEFGGIGLPIKGHLWADDKNWGYITMKSIDDVTNEYIKYIKELKELSKHGICAGVYTQTTDVEGEVNGLMTYDRKVMKVDVAKVRQINQSLIK